MRLEALEWDGVFMDLIQGSWDVLWGSKGILLGF